jgi:hypothetical protein
MDGSMTAEGVKTFMLSSVVSKRRIQPANHGILRPLTGQDHIRRLKPPPDRRPATP